MQPLDSIKVSFYKDVFSRQPEEVSLLVLLEAIIKGKYSGAVNTIRRYHQEGDNATAQKLKSKLPCFTPSGTFGGAHAIKNLLTYSKIVSLDYDHVHERERLIELCAADPHTVSVIESPTDGLKIFAYVENVEGRHREGVRAVSSYYDRLLGLTCDAACKDESRLCYVSYSPNGYVAALYDSFVLPPQETESETRKFVMSYFFANPPIEGKRNSTLFKLACEACKCGLDQDSVFGEILLYFGETDFPKSEIERTLSSGYKSVKSNTNHKSASSKASANCHQTVNCQYVDMETAGEQNEAYWEGEELRKNTPLFGDDLYEKLPPLLSDCMIDGITSREKDCLLLSCLTSLSSVMPKTIGTYDKKRFTPHLYCVITAPAGSGKSIALWGRNLLDHIHEQTLKESEAAHKNYKNNRNEWQADCARKMKDKEKINYDNEPVEPPYKMLIIPATTSHTRMQIQLRDNHSLGGIIIDAEAQSLSVANGLECGKFDDMLCKAFGHENIDSSYKANGMKPIVIRRPSLALLLTGTPSQLHDLLTSSENGLFSRIIFYTYRENPSWKEMGEDDVSPDDLFDHLSARVHELYLFCLRNPVEFRFTRSQWKKLNHTFSSLLSEVSLDGSDDLQAVVKRHALIVMRVCMIFSRLRQFDADTPFAGCGCTDEDFDTVLSLVLCCYYHSRLLLLSMPAKPLSVLKNPDKTRDYINSLPENFTTDEALNLAESYSFSPSKVMRLLKSLTGVSIKKLSHGNYCRLHVEYPCIDS